MQQNEHSLISVCDWLCVYVCLPKIVWSCKTSMKMVTYSAFPHIKHDCVSSVIKHLMKHTKKVHSQKRISSSQILCESLCVKKVVLITKKKGLYFTLERVTWSKIAVPLLFSASNFRLVRLLRQRPFQRRINLWFGPCWSRFDPVWTFPRLCCPLSSWSQDPSWTSCLITTSMQTSCQSKTLPFSFFSTILSVNWRNSLTFWKCTLLCFFFFVCVLLQ